ncbi:hypothetical protein Adt_21597 [Abeliophyllum distichum]|uniref:Uncharacterized protein n=1 Tax=Abeliophyllum distichum TaxID=126358 RepID=A0ABD1T012_9LAMI
MSRRFEKRRFRRRGCSFMPRKFEKKRLFLYTEEVKMKRLFLYAEEVLVPVDIIGGISARDFDKNHYLLVITNALPLAIIDDNVLVYIRMAWHIHPINIDGPPQSPPPSSTMKNSINVHQPPKPGPNSKHVPPTPSTYVIQFPERKSYAIQHLKMHENSMPSLARKTIAAISLSTSYYFSLSRP